MAPPPIPQWKGALAQQLGIKLTPAVSTFFDHWARAEGGDASNNPFNTTQEMPGAGSYNSVGVRNYISPAQGISATARTLKNGRYGNILQAMQEGQDPMKMAQALAASPWGTGGLVVKMLGGTPSISGTQPTPAPGGDLGNGSLAPPPPNRLAMSLPQLLKFSAPSPGAVRVLQGASPMAGAAAQASQQEIPLPNMQQVQQQNQLQSPSGEQVTKPDPYAPPVVPHTGGLDGTVPMVQGGNISQRYPNLRIQSNVDWHHINPRLLDTLEQVAAKRGAVIVLSSGYRSNDYSQKVGGFVGDPHTKGLAVDAYINGHPVGEVVAPEEWAKYGVRSGNTPGFFKGNPDPEHLDLVGIPIKGGR